MITLAAPAVPSSSRTAWQWPSVRAVNKALGGLAGDWQVRVSLPTAYLAIFSHFPPPSLISPYPLPLPRPYVLVPTCSHTSMSDPDHHEVNLDDVTSASLTPHPEQRLLGHCTAIGSCSMGGLPAPASRSPFRVRTV